jgi:hypothetical protein
MQSDAGLDALDVKLNQFLNGKVVRKDPGPPHQEGHQRPNLRA